MGYCHRKDDISESVHDNHFCLKRDSKGFYVWITHAYYYQVQTQLFVCGVDYCDFVVHTFPDDSQDVSIHIDVSPQTLNSGLVVLNSLRFSSELVSCWKVVFASRSIICKTVLLIHLKTQHIVTVSSLRMNGNDCL